MHFAPSDGEILWHAWVDSEPNVFLEGEQVDEVDRFSYLNICILSDDHKPDEVFSRVQKAR